MECVSIMPPANRHNQRISRKTTHTSLWYSLSQEYWISSSSSSSKSLASWWNHNSHHHNKLVHNVLDIKTPKTKAYLMGRWGHVCQKLLLFCRVWTIYTKTFHHSLPWKQKKNVSNIGKRYHLGIVSFGMHVQKYVCLLKSKSGVGAQFHKL